ncbi:O-antigen ligase family protein [Haladaptatus salinisoli]|uniref:O-antigen ligase family protein n=1 Tax=Haladaptatus salinisoli TaxID=2884876 RepID=UPI001D09D5A6|nr:O-antigen ligase family protein [Haladaptatus salinisoli]
MDLIASNDARTNPWSRVLLLTVTLVLGLMLVAPLFRVFVRLTGLPLPLPLLWGVGFAGLAYAAVVARERAWILGGIVALVVFATFNADVPFMAAAHRYPKDVVARLLLVHFPLAYLCAVAVAKGWYRDSASVPVYLLAGFVAATLLSALLGVRPRLVPAGFFVLYAVELVALVWLVETAIARDLVAPRQLAVVFLIAVIGHSLVGVAQFLNQDPFGMTYLGEGGMHNRVWLTLPLAGTFSIGPFVAGFTGISFTLAVFCTAAVPLAIGMAFRARDWRRPALVAGLVLLVVIIRFSASDSVRGAFLLTLLAYGGLLAVLARRNASPLRPSRGTVVRAACLTLVLVSIVALPSMASDTSFSIPDGDSASAPTDPASHGQSPSTTTTETTTTETTETTETTTETATTTRDAPETTGGEATKEVSIPLFSTKHLGVRFRQYAVALDVFASHPVVGIGGMNFVHVAEEYGLPVPDGYAHPRLIHNTYLALLTETGLLGFALYAGAIAVVGYYGWRLLRSRSTGTLLVAGTLAGLLGIAAYSFWNPQLYNAKITFVFWILAATISGEYRKRRP